MSTEPFPAPGEPGRTWIADQIVAKIASAAAREVEGVEDLRGGSIRRGWTRSSDRRQSGAGVRIENGQAAIDLRLVVRDGIAIPEVVDAVRAQVTERVQFGTGLAVSQVDIGVVDVVPGPEAEAEAEREPEADSETATASETAAEPAEASTKTPPADPE
jgi:uncharacterized alkaline shock family protein YloU